MTLNQQNLVAVHEHMKSLAEQWLSGLIADIEFAEAMAKVSEAFTARKHELNDLVDPNTCLRYGKGLQIEATMR
jgi:hypothetical protein